MEMRSLILAVISTHVENKKAFLGKLTALLIAATAFFVPLCIFSCGGGGGGGGMAAFNTDGSGYHNGGTTGGWGSGNTTGNGFGGNGGGLGSGNDSNVVITGSTPLEVGT